MDDLLLASLDQEKCWEGTKALLALLSWKKAQVCQQEVRYLGFIILEGQRTLGLEKKWVVFCSPQLNTKKEVRELLGVAGCCCLWTPE
jgi:hypothetical protein